MGPRFASFDIGLGLLQADQKHSRAETLLLGAKPDNRPGDTDKGKAHVRAKESRSRLFRRS